MNSKTIDHGTLSEDELAELMVKLATFSEPVQTEDGRCIVDISFPRYTCQEVSNGVLFEFFGDGNTHLATIESIEE